MTAIYNENDPRAAAWLRELIAHGHIAPGVVDERSITDLTPADASGPGQRHFFAGIGGWSCALRIAGVPDDADIWTGSCPCQPFSSAGRGRGVNDDRHLWPTWFRLIAECRPAIVFGEQVASKAGLGWLDAVFADLEGAGYACAAADLPAASVGAPHKRQRLFFVANANGEHGRLHASQWQPGRADAQARRSREAGQLANATSHGRIERINERTAIDGNGSRPAHDSRKIKLGNPSGKRGRRNAGAVFGEKTPCSSEGGKHRDHANRSSYSGPTDWSICSWIPCSDGVSRPAEPGTHPLAHGVPGRVGLLRGYGNAIVPQVAAAFVTAALEAIAS